MLSDPYWKLVFHLSEDTEAHTIGQETATFRTKTFTEFSRFLNLVQEGPIIEKLLEDLEPTDTFYDVGANVGTYTCFVASNLGSKRTIAFEPEPNNVDSLEANLDLNDLDAEIAEVALSNSTGTTELALAGDEAGEGEHAIATRESGSTIEVPVWTGDEFIDEHGIEPPTVIKIDVEGAELNVLRGLRETLQEHCRLIYVEVHHAKLPDFDAKPGAVADFLDEMGFDVTELSQRGDQVFLRASR